MIARQLSTCDLYVRRIPTFTPSFPCCPNSPRSGATLISNTGLKNICADLWGAFLLFFATVFVCCFLLFAGTNLFVGFFLTNAIGMFA